MLELDMGSQHIGFKVLMDQHSAECDTLNGETGKIADIPLKLVQKLT